MGGATVFALCLFGFVGYVAADQWIGMGWLGAIVGVALVAVVAFMDFVGGNH